MVSYDKMYVISLYIYICRIDRYDLWYKYVTHVYIRPRSFYKYLVNCMCYVGIFNINSLQLFFFFASITISLIIMTFLFLFSRSRET